MGAVMADLKALFKHAKSTAKLLRACPPAEVPTFAKDLLADLDKIESAIQALPAPESPDSPGLHACWKFAYQAYQIAKEKLPVSKHRYGDIFRFLQTETGRRLTSQLGRLPDRQATFTHYVRSHCRAAKLPNPQRRRRA